MYDKYTQAAAVTAHDTNSPASGYSGAGWDALYIGVTGDVSAILEKDSSAVTFTNMKQGTIYPIGCKVVRSTSTTATNMVVLDNGSMYS